MSYLCAKGITAGYGKQPVIADINFQLEEGRLMGIIGANGSGKTTLLKALCGICPTRGAAPWTGKRWKSFLPGKWQGA